MVDKAYVIYRLCKRWTCELLHPVTSVASYGLDSLVSVELQNWVSRFLGGHVQTFELMSSMSMVQLAEVVARRSRLVPAGVFGDA
jgi:emericellamide synthase (highly reducing iterative type I polyketide synthase)